MSYAESREIYPPLHASVMTLFDEIMYPGDIFEKRPNDTKYFDMFTLATHSGYRGKGIGSNLIKEGLKIGRKVDCSACIVLATNDFSRKIFQKFKFDLIASKEWKDCLYDGRPAFGDVQSENATAHYLKL